MREQFEEGKRQVVQEAIAAGVSEKNFFGVKDVYKRQPGKLKR